MAERLLETVTGQKKKQPVLDFGRPPHGSLLESAKLVGIEPKAYLRRAITAALRSETISLPHEDAASISKRRIESCASICRAGGCNSTTTSDDAWQFGAKRSADDCCATSPAC
jgi:hypothetical protein